MKKIFLNKQQILLLVFFLILFSCKDKTTEDAKINDLLSKMTLQEKIGQMNQLNGRNPNENLFEQIRKGEAGSILNAEKPELVNQLQKISVEESRLGIPLLIARDVIHGYKTIFPIPLGQAASFNPDIVEKGARIAAIESSEYGIRWTFAPMIDISRDARWGRIAESFGEDTYLSECLGVAMVKGFQGDDLSQPSSIAACAKHFVGYGAAEGGRDYNSTFIPERLLRNVYFPPFESAVKAGCATIMTSFNDNDGVPSSGNKFILKDVLRDEWKFDGVVVSDWASVREMIKHGFCANESEATISAVNAGLDMDMVSYCYIQCLDSLVKAGAVSEKIIDNAVRNILRLKFRLGLFDHPYIDTNEKSKAYCEDHLQAAKQAATESFVLLKNEKNTLPLSSSIKKLAIIGPLADAPHDQMGTWCFDGDKTKIQTPLNAFREIYGKDVEIIYEQTLAYSRDKNKSAFPKAISAAQKSDAIVVFVGEESILSGEAHCLAELNLQGEQSTLIKELKKTGKPIIMVVMAGRPLTIAEEVDLSDAVLYAWHPGTMGGPAIADMIFGKTVPSGKLPVTFPKYVGQIPMYYNHNNTGRPAKRTEILLNDIPLEPRQSSLGCTSFYLDAAFDPLFPFGYGLSYTTFEYKDLKLSSDNLNKTDTLSVKFTLSNTGKYDATEIVQLYVRDMVGSITRPVKELKAFERIFLKSGERKEINMQLPIQQLAFWNIDFKKTVEPGDFQLMLGTNSIEGLKADFKVK